MYFGARLSWTIWRFNTRKLLQEAKWMTTDQEAISWHETDQLVENDKGPRGHSVTGNQWTRAKNEDIENHDDQPLGGWQFELGENGPRLAQ